MPFRIQIINAENGEVAASWAPGSAVEQEFVQSAVAAITAKGIGVFKTEAQVQSAIESGLRDLLYNLKLAVKPT